VNWYLECPEHNASLRSNIGWKTSEIISKNGGKVGKIECCVKLDLCSWRWKASLFYRKTTWQAFIFHQNKSFKQHTSEIGGSRCNCLVSRRGMTLILCWTIQKIILQKNIKNYFQKYSFAPQKYIKTSDQNELAFYWFSFDLVFMKCICNMYRVFYEDEHAQMLGVSIGIKFKSYGVYSLTENIHSQSVNCQFQLRILQE